MAAGQLNFRIEAGNTFHSTLIWTDENNDPVDLTGYTAVMDITSPKSIDFILYFTLSTGNGRITFDAPNGTIFLDIDAVDTATFTTWEKDFGSYKLELTVGLDVIRLIEGSVILHD